MGILDMARRDARKIVSDKNGFATLITFSFNDISVQVYGTAKKHHTRLDDLGNVVSGLEASCTVAEKDLTDKGYPVRDSNNYVDLRMHKVSWADGLGQQYSYTIQDYYPDELLGLLVLILGH